MAALRIVPGVAWDASDDQVQRVNDGIEATSSTVVPLDSAFDSYVVLDGDEPVGLLSVMPINASAVEVGVRFWDRKMTAARVLGRSLTFLFDVYDYVLARCYASNMDVRHLVQRAGFILLNVDRVDGRSVHVYGCRKDDFYRVMPRGLVHG